MAKIDLKVAEPDAFDRGANETAAQMIYGDTDSPIVIDTETALIECEAQNKSAPINQWVVDFGNHKMMLASEVTDESYRKIDFATAVGMIGQLVMVVGQRTFLTLLTTIKEKVYATDDSPVPPQSPASDAPAENLPESPKEADLPTPVNPDEV